MKSHPPCPFCRSPLTRRPAFTWWGGVFGAPLLGVLRCESCGRSFHARSGRPATLARTLYALATALLAVILGLCLFFYLSGRW